jgi:hypothetical protein
MDVSSQDEVDRGFTQQQKTWQTRLTQSGLSEALFVSIGEGSLDFLEHFARFKRQALAQGFDVPDLIPGIGLDDIDLLIGTAL